MKTLIGTLPHSLAVSLASPRRCSASCVASSASPRRCSANPLAASASCRAGGRNRFRQLAAQPARPGAWRAACRVGSSTLADWPNRATLPGPPGSGRLRMPWARMFVSEVGAWRSLVAHLHGVQGVGGSNPLAPTNLSLRESCSFARGFGVRCPFRARGREQCDRHDGGEVEGAVCHEWRRRLYRQREDRAPLGHMTILWIQPDASGDQEPLISTGSRGSPARYGWMISMLVVGPNRVSTPSGVTSAA